METLIQAPKGTTDVLPKNIHRWHFIEQKLEDVCHLYGYQEVRTPTFEHTELFLRGVGETTDIVGKEMYTMTDKGGRSITLRPEGTAGVVRAFLQHGVLQEMLPVRAYYLGPCFRYEKPQSGRLREFHQLGCELFGAPTADADAEVIRLANALLTSVGIRDTKLSINSIGCPTCRPAHHEALCCYFEEHIDDMCSTCRDRLARNPLRILDCKNPACIEIASRAPSILDDLCPDCDNHFTKLRELLEAMEIPFVVDDRIVRGLDYYSRTVFEFVHTGAGAQGTVCGGGRYDSLTSFLGGETVPGIGFAIGLERLLLVMEAEGIEVSSPAGPDLFVGCVGEEAGRFVAALIPKLQAKGLYALYDLNGRSLKAQLKYAGRLRAKQLLVIGEGELSSDIGTLRDMETKEEKQTPLSPEAIFINLGFADDRPIGQE